MIFRFTGTHVLNFGIGKLSWLQCCTLNNQCTMVKFGEVRWKHGSSVFWTLASCDRRVEQYTIPSVSLICNVMGGWLQAPLLCCHGSDVAHTLTIKLSPPSPGQPSPSSIVVISLNNHFEQFLSKQHLFCTSHFLPFVITTFDTS